MVASGFETGREAGKGGTGRESNDFQSIFPVIYIMGCLRSGNVFCRSGGGFAGGLVIWVFDEETGFFGCAVCGAGGVFCRCVGVHVRLVGWAGAA